jgi:UPF0755 protein
MNQWVKVIAGLLLCGGLYGYYSFSAANVPTSLNDNILKIPTGCTRDSLPAVLLDQGFILDTNSYKRWSNMMDFQTVRSGRYKIAPNWSNYELIRHLQRSEQVSVKIMLNTEKNAKQIAAKLSKSLEADSLAFITAFSDTLALDSLGLKPETLQTVIFPDTYEFYWNTSPAAFLKKMVKKHKAFWTEARLEKAKTANLTPLQVHIMASIVEGEASHNDERARVAGVYLNRLQKNILLQADPTVQYALMDIYGGGYRRLYNKDYQFAHRYNTYINLGLPPGPVGLASPASIDAVLSPETHEYIYFCAKPDNSGYHNFAVTHEAHLINVKNYQNWKQNKTNSSN